MSLLDLSKDIFLNVLLVKINRNSLVNFMLCNKYLYKIVYHYLYENYYYCISTQTVRKTKNAFKKYDEIKEIRILNTNLNPHAFKKIISFHKNLEVLYLHLNQEIDLSENINLKKICFDFYFNQPLDLSKNINLEDLDLGTNFNQPLDLSKNVNLKELTLSDYYTYPLDLTNCVNLEHLDLGSNFNQPLDLTNFVNLKFLQLGRYYDYTINLSKNVYLESLYLDRDYNQPLDLSENIYLRFLCLSNLSEPVTLDHLKYLRVIELNGYTFPVNFNIFKNLEYINAYKYREIIDVSELNIIEIKIEDDEEIRKQIIDGDCCALIYGIDD